MYNDYPCFRSSTGLPFSRVFSPSQTIDYQEFVSGLSYFHENAPIDQKIDCECQTLFALHPLSGLQCDPLPFLFALISAVAFNLFDLGGDEVIHRSELKQILEPSFAGVFKPEQIDSIVDTTFEQFGECAAAAMPFFRLSATFIRLVKLFPSRCRGAREGGRGEVNDDVIPQIRGNVS